MTSLPRQVNHVIKTKKLTKAYQVVNDLFCMQDDLSIYNLLLEEIKSCGIAEGKVSSEN